MGLGSDSDSSETAVRRRRSRGLRAEADAFLRAHNRRKSPAAGPSAAPPAQPIDAARLSRFRETAQSFIADAPAPVKTDDRIAFQKLHEEAVHILDNVAAARKVSPKDSLVVARGQGRYTAMRIRRDKQRLEQQYLAAMSFLDKADAGDANVLIEEQELGEAALEEKSAAAEKQQLENYAREAMSFLDKAFNQDESVLIDDEESDEDYRDDLKFHGQGAAHLEYDSDNASPNATEDQLPGNSGEAESIAHDRRQLERYAEEYGDFLEKAYVDDTTVIVDDSESQTSASERGLYGRNALPSPSSSQDTYHDDLSDAYTDDEFQDPTIADPVMPSSPLPIPSPDHRSAWRKRSPGAASNSSEQDQRDAWIRMTEYEQEADEFLSTTNIPEEVDQTSDDEEIFTTPSYEPTGPRRATRTMSDSEDELHGVSGIGTPIAEEVVLDDDFGARQIVDDVQEVGDVDDSPKTVSDGNGSRDNGSAHSTPYLDRKRGTPRKSPFHSSALPPPAPRSSPLQQLHGADMTVKVFAPDQADGSKEWTEVPLEPSFYRKLKRGSTVQILPRAGPAMEEPSSGPAKSRSQGGIKLAKQQERRELPPALAAELTKIASERDAVIGALEEIVNERNKIAAQVGEMREMIAEAVGQKQTSPSSKGDESEDIDISEELQSAYDTMRQITDETELTINVLENKYDEIAEEKVQLEKLLEEHQVENDELKEQIANMKRDGSGKKCLKCRDMANLEVEIENAKFAAKEAEIGKAELEKKIRELKRDMQTKLRNANARQNLLVEDQRELQNKYDNLESVREGERLLISEMQSNLDEANRRANDLKNALEASESNLLNERMENEGLAARHRSISQLEAEAGEADALRAEVRSNREKLEQLEDKLRDSEREAEKLRHDLMQSIADNETTHEELRNTTAKYEESLRAREASASQSMDAAESQRALKELQRESRAREDALRNQMSEFKEHAEQAVAAAAMAEQNAVDAASAAAMAQENAKVQIAAEKAARKGLEAELLQKDKDLKAKADEAKQWERYAREQAERDVVQAGGLVPSGSRRGVAARRMQAKSPEWRARTKKDGGAASSGRKDGPPSGSSGAEEVVSKRKRKNFGLFG